MTFLSTLLASVVANTAANPLDVVKSRLQQQQKSASGPKYSGMIMCFRECVREEGFAVLMRGWIPAFIKLAPYVILSLSLSFFLSA